MGARPDVLRGLCERVIRGYRTVNNPLALLASHARLLTVPPHGTLRRRAVTTMIGFGVVSVVMAALVYVLGSHVLTQAEQAILESMAR